MTTPFSNQSEIYQNNNFDEIQKENDRKQRGQNINSGFIEEKSLLSVNICKSVEENKKNNNKNDLAKQCTESGSDNRKQDDKKNESNENITAKIINTPKSNEIKSETKKNKKKIDKKNKNTTSSSNSQYYIVKKLVKEIINKKNLRIIFGKNYKKLSPFEFINNEIMCDFEVFENLFLYEVNKLFDNLEFLMNQKLLIKSEIIINIINSYVNEYNNNISDLINDIPNIVYSPGDSINMGNVCNIININSNRERHNSINSIDLHHGDYSSSLINPL